MGSIEDEDSERGIKSAAFDSAPIGVTVSDRGPGGGFVYANDEFLRMTGYSEEDITGEGYETLFGRESSDERTEELADAVRDGGTLSTEMVCYTRDGDTFWNSITVASFEEGGDEYVLGFHEDVTDRREQETELRRQNRRLNEFASIVSHDLRNPLNVAEKRLESYAEEHDDRRLDQARKGIERMNEIIDSLLTLTRDGQTVDDPVPLDTGEVAEEAWSNVDTSEAGLRIEDSTTVTGDRERLVRVFENLFKNAVEHAGDDTSVSVGIPDGDADGFYIEDDGPGIPEFERDTVFDRGYSTGDSSGFGLYIVENIVETHGWDIEVEDGDEGGARFVVTTPTD